MKKFQTLLLGGLMLVAAAAAASETPPLPFDEQRAIANKSVAAAPYWTDLGKDLEAGLPVSTRGSMPEKYRALRLDYPALQALLNDAPYEKDARTSAGLEITLPLPDGRHQRFEIYESPMISDELQARVPGFRTFVARGIDDPAATLRLGIDATGFHAFGRTSLGTLWIDSYRMDDRELHFSSWNHDFKAPDDIMGCLVEDRSEGPDLGLKSIPTSGAQLKTYRTIVTLTGEYTTYFGSTGVAISKALTSFNRVNSVLEIDLAVRLNVIDVNAYADPATDPFPTGGTINVDLNNQNIATTNAIYGEANYDLGHILTQGGLAGVAVIYVGGGNVCTNLKASGSSSQVVPEGDPFDIKLICHEVGHQLGARHTWNSDTCAGSPTAGSSYEPGSGSTIMAYAGICGAAENVQSNTDPYYHTHSLEQIISNTDAQSCAALTANGNTPPVANAGADYTIPRNTAFYVIGGVTDPDADAHTYTWEQYDLGAASPPIDAYGVLFRSFPPSAANYRYFPDWGQVFSGATDPWETLPTVDRNLTLRVTVRDNAIGGGGVDDDEIELTVLGDPFEVTFPNGGESFTGGQQVNVTWNVGGSVASTIKILLFTGFGFETLTGSTPNDGAEIVTLPCGATYANARIWIEENTGILEGVHVLDVSDADITLTDGTPDFASVTFPGWTDPVVINPLNSAAPPTSLTAGTPNFFRASWGNFGTAAGCEGFIRQMKIDETLRYTFTDYLERGLIYGQGLGGQVVRGGRHTVWQHLDPDDVQAELDETNNGYARQWVWTPLNLSPETATQYSQPPERFAGHQFIPSGTTAYGNMDGMRSLAPPSTWRAAAISSLNGSDYDIYFFDPTTGPDDGYATPLASSRFGGGSTDVVLANSGTAGLFPYDVGYERYGGDGDYIGDHRESQLMLFTGDNVDGIGVAENQVIDLTSLYVAPSDLGYIMVLVENAPTDQPVQVAVFSAALDVVGRGFATATANVDANGRAAVTFDAQVGGEWCVMLVRNASEGLAPFSYDLQVVANPVDIAMVTLAGSHGPVVPQDGAPIGAGSPVPAPATLPGDSFDTVLYFHVTNQGFGLAENWELSLLRDGAVTEILPGIFSMPGGLPTIYSQAYGGGYFVSGGRHTSGMAYDANNDYVEILESNNRHAEQWVWEPTQLTMGQSVFRSSPPANTGGWDDIPVGLPREVNQDGLRTPAFAPAGNNGYWGGFAVTPLGSGDVDLHVHTVSTGAQDGFDDFLTSSSSGGGVTEFVLFDMDNVFTAGTAFDMGAELAAGSAPTSYQANATQSLYLADGPTGSRFAGFTLGAGELLGVHEFYVPFEGVTNFVIQLENEGGGADLGLAIFDRSSASGVYTLFDAPFLADANGPGGDEVVAVELPDNQFYGVAVYKVGSGDVNTSVSYALDFPGAGFSPVGDLPVAQASLRTYPNPFNPQANIKYALETPGRASLKIYDAQGRLIRTLVSADLPAGTHTAVWKGRDDAGRSVASGVYLARFVHPDGVERQRMVLMK